MDRKELVGTRKKEGMAYLGYPVIQEFVSKQTEETNKNLC
jgi:hypothetical protein